MHPTLERVVSSPTTLPQTSVLSNYLSNSTSCHGQGDCPCHSCHVKEVYPCLPSHGSGCQVIRDFLADSASHLDQIDCSSDLCLQDHFLIMHDKCYSSKDSCHPVLFPVANIYPLHPPVAALNPLLHCTVAADLPSSLMATPNPLQSLVEAINLVLSVTVQEVGYMFLSSYFLVSFYHALCLIVCYSSFCISI